jgi:hypothetical protein
MKIKTNELNGDALDWAVSYCVEWSNKFPIMPFKVLPYSSHWAQGGHIIEREKMRVAYNFDEHIWEAGWDCHVKGWADTPLIAAMRCYVASKLGDEVEVPYELLQGASE